MKVLIVSHNPISTYQSMGKTMLSLFSSFSKDELCQLYIYPTLPDVDVCSSCFRITDRNVFNSYFKFGRIESKTIGSNEIDETKHVLFESREDNTFLNRSKTYSKLLVRDLLWKFSHWYDAKLEDWLQKQKANVIFLAPGECTFIYDIALKIQKIFEIPIVTYLCDEFYFVDSPKSLVGKIHFRKLHKKIELLMKKSSKLITICDELKESYSNRFDIPSMTIFTGSNITSCEEPKIVKEIKGITYFGNLAYNRFDSIMEIGKAIDRYNNEKRKNYKLFLYTRELSFMQQQLVRDIDSIEYCGYVTGAEFHQRFSDSDCLLHIEAFDEESVDRVKHSISTKIADSLASGIPLVAYGPSNIASISYLHRECCALVITNKDELFPLLSTFFEDIFLRENLAKKAIIVANKYHNSKTNSEQLKEALLEIVAN